jgi:uncharacterized membrane protein YcgQ (UPF0703/DUF1980 family)
MSGNNLIKRVSAWLKRYEPLLFLYACFVVVVSFSLELLIKHYSVTAHNALVGVFLTNLIVLGGLTFVVLLILGEKMKWVGLLLLAVFIPYAWYISKNKKWRI